MFGLKRSTFGRFEKYDLFNPSSNTGLSIVPSWGASLIDLSFNGVTVLDSCQTPEELHENIWAKNSFLFPFPNRLKDGAFQFEGHTYQFPINEASTNTALHGFGLKVKTAIEEVQLSAHTGLLRLFYAYPGHYPHFPFPFHLTITFLLTSSNSLTISYKVTNSGATTLPFGFGWHPYFELSESVGTIKMKLPECQKVEIDEALIPTGKRSPFPTFSELTTINDTVLDNCFELVQTQGTNKVEVIMEGDSGQLRYWQETGLGKFNFIQLFIPPAKKAVAVEPMTCNIDAFNNKEGLILLNPGESAKGSFGLQFSSL